jgi:Protein NO VEIN, C-terminal
VILDPREIPTRQKLILTGLFLSKYDAAGLRKLGFESFIEAFNVIGYALGQKPASIKNYRDEFDPLFPNKRKGWHKRPTREYCFKVFKDYKALDLETFSGLIRSFTGYDENTWSEIQSKREQDGSESFAKRLITGLAAEQYFESVQPQLPEFKNHLLENTTRLGCGYDFRLHLPGRSDFFAIEVKGLKERNGNLSLTPKEYEVASALTDQFFLFIVKNFRESPFHEMHQNPLATSLRFVRKERVTVQVSWLTSV